GNLEQCMRIVRDAPEDVMVISGDDMLTVPLYALGAKGVISVLANAYATIFRKMKDYSFAGNYKRAAVEQRRLLDINGPMYEEGKPVGVKYVLEQMGVCGGFVRQPLLPATQQLKKKIDAAMA